MSKHTRRIVLTAAVIAVLATACPPGLRAPFNGQATVNHAYRNGTLAEPACTLELLSVGYPDCTYHPHPALDFYIPYGTPVLAAESGFVFISDWENDQWPDRWLGRPGTFVVINHQQPSLTGIRGYTPPPYTRYSHLSLAIVSAGQWVKRGQTVGYAGNTQSPNTHLHFDAPKDLIDATPTGGFNHPAFRGLLGRIEWCTPQPENGWREVDEWSAYWGFTMNVGWDGNGCR